MMEYEEYENPANDDGMDVEADMGNSAEAEIIDDEDIPVTQEDAWAVIRYGWFGFSCFL
jgi:hypothetical protein